MRIAYSTQSWTEFTGFVCTLFEFAHCWMWYFIALRRRQEWIGYRKVVVCWESLSDNEAPSHSATTGSRTFLTESCLGDINNFIIEDNKVDHDNDTLLPRMIDAFSHLIWMPIFQVYFSIIMWFINGLFSLFFISIRFSFFMLWWHSNFHCYRTTQCDNVYSIRFSAG